MNRRPRRFALALALLVGLLVASDLVWFRSGGAPLHWDAAIHLGASVDANRAFEPQPDALGSPLLRRLDFTWYYPPLVYWCVVPFHRAFGESPSAGILGIAFFHAFLVIATYALAARLYSPEVGLLAALWTGTAPIVLDFARQFMLDLPLATLVVIALVLLVRSESFRRWPGSLAFGVLAGCGMLAKWTFACFLLVPVLTTIWMGVRDPLARARVWRNATLASVACLLVAGPWYVTHLVPILGNRSGQLGHDQRSVWQMLVYYGAALPGQLSWPGALAALLGTMAFLRTRQPHRELLVWVAGTYVILTLIDFKFPRFSLPLVPLVAIVASAGWIGWSRAAGPQRRRWAVAGFAAVLFIQALLITFVPRTSAAGRMLWRSWGETPIVPVAGPRHDDWRQADILKRIQIDLQEAGRAFGTLRVVPDHLFFNRPTFECAATFDRLPIQVIGVAGIPLLMDYVVLKTGDIGVHAPKRVEIQSKIALETSGIAPLYRIVERFALPDSSEAQLLAVSRTAAGTNAESIRTRVETLSDQLVRGFMRPLEKYEIAVEPWDEPSTLAGRFRHIRIRAARSELGDFAHRPEGVAVQDLDVELRDVRLAPAALAGHDLLQFVGAEEMRLGGLRIEAQDLSSYLEASSHGKTRVHSLTMRDGVLLVDLELRKPKIRFVAGFALRTRDDNISFECTKLRIGPVPVPPMLVDVLAHAYDPLLEQPEGIARIRLDELHVEGDALSIGPTPRR